MFFFLIFWERKTKKKSFHEFQQQSFALLKLEKSRGLDQNLGLDRGFQSLDSSEKLRYQSVLLFADLQGAVPPGNIFLTLASVAVPRQGKPLKNRSVAMLYDFSTITECRFVDSVEIKLTEHYSPIVLPVVYSLFK